MQQSFNTGGVLVESSGGQLPHMVQGGNPNSMSLVTQQPIITTAARSSPPSVSATGNTQELGFSQNSILPSSSQFLNANSLTPEQIEQLRSILQGVPKMHAQRIAQAPQAVWPVGPEDSGLTRTRPDGPPPDQLSPVLTDNALSTSTLRTIYEERNAFQQAMMKRKQEDEGWLKKIGTHLTSVIHYSEVKYRLFLVEITVVMI